VLISARLQGVALIQNLYAAKEWIRCDERHTTKKFPLLDSKMGTTRAAAMEKT
jgi:hypothetical protein